MSSNSTDYSLSTLLSSSPYTLAYSLPLFFVSLVLTFAGTFLTLDRTRAFAPRSDIRASAPASKGELARVEHRVRWLLLLEGGLGGLSSGYVFGVHLATFLALLLPSVTTSPKLTDKSFMAVWILAAVCCTFVAGRWRYAALLSAGIAGYSTLALALSVIIHPSLLTRIVLTAIFLPIGTILCLLPLPKYQHACMRVATSASGAFGVIVSIALLANVPSWSNVWERLWLSEGSGWGTAVEKGLSAGYCLILLIGAACDWLLGKKFGENPDEIWDQYLAEYAAGLPHAADRAGTFRPIRSFWERHFGHDRSGNKDVDISSSSDASLKRPLSSPDAKKRRPLAPAVPDALSSDVPKSYLKKHRKYRGGAFPGLRRKRDPIKFKPLAADDVSSSEEGSDFDPKENLPPFRRPYHRTNSSATLVTAKELASNPLKAKSGGARDAAAPEYSDYEDDVAYSSTEKDRDGPNWSPAFLRRHSLSTKSDTTASRTAVEHQSPSTLTSSRTPLDSYTVSVMPVPATPSLIRAIDRVSAAQRAAYSPPSSSTVSLHAGGLKWDSFWRDVRAKAKHENTQ
ncbi:hypothetical protein WOLCODRAFT_131346 [Wolfiporia cocos MD-104 SS10]|uniref:DUF4203 domain-containing protein n=1 Tax=Wolfiporia cocos (strain MD-104) TaxID=742152 RepID=A0A2H3JUC0_WOLCO|nr:hypothetical protein WOLCODRAFT_131346 [Wolfiporia cocos MD-104 SS10]